MFAVLLLVFAYLMGSIPFGLIVARMLGGQDPRQVGSGNVGATNVSRVVGAKWGALVLALDLAKGFLPVEIAAEHFHGWFFLSLVALAAIFGHTNSCFLRFKGGKAVATTIGVFLALTPWAAVLSAVACLGVIWISRYVSLGSLTFAIGLPVFCLVTGQFGFIPLALVVMGILFAKHKDNILRLARGEENPFGRKS